MMKVTCHQVTKNAQGSLRMLFCCAEFFRFVVSAVELPPGFIAETVATNLNAAAAIACAPDSRIFIADQTGLLLVWKDGRVLDQPALELRVTDYWERGLIGLALDPGFPRVPHLYVLYVTDKPFVHHVLSRFTMDGDRVDPASEKILLEGDDQAKLGGSVPAGHQGGTLRFGLGGRLYASIGEQTAGEPAQRLDTLQGKILRLNSDGSIPEDNPFFNQTVGKYRAIYARGVRNSFGLATQSQTDGGRMFFTDVGGSAFEEVNELRPGANYGWPHAEGFSTNSAFTEPLHAYPPMIGQSIVGGAFVPKTPSTWPVKWRGKFLFGDFMKHWVKALDPAAPTNVITFAKGFNGPVATELAPDGSLLVLNRGAVWRDPKKFVANAGSLLRIRYISGATLASRRSTSDAARANFTPALGLPANAGNLPREMSSADWERRFEGVKRWPFWLNSDAWQPFAHERIGLYLPSGTAMKLTNARSDVQLPPGAVIVRDFEVRSRPASRAQDRDLQQIETRLLVVGAPHGYGASYRWKSPDLAELVEDGEFKMLADFPGARSSKNAPEKASIMWWFPGVDDGIAFPISNPAYWVSAAVQDFLADPSPAKPDRRINWLLSMKQSEVLETTLSVEALDELPRGFAWQGATFPAEGRVRSYLHGNCAVCHQPGGASRGAFDARLSTPFARAGIVNGELAAGDLGIAGAKVVVPGSPEKSILYQRLKRTDFFRMPPVQYHNEPSPILPILEEWIRSLGSVPDSATK